MSSIYGILTYLILDLTMPRFMQYSNNNANKQNPKSKNETFLILYQNQGSVIWILFIAQLTAKLSIRVYKA